MARTPPATTVAGLIPQDPRYLPGLQWSPRQQQALHNALRQAPHPSWALRQVREGLQQQRPLQRIIEDLRQHNALVALRPYTAHPPPRDALTPIPDRSRDPRRNGPPIPHPSRPRSQP